MNDLGTLLHDAAHDSPADGFDVTAVVRAGRSRVRRRRAAVGVAALTTVGLVAAVPVGLARLDRGGVPAPADSPGRALSLADAVAAEPGRDYTAVTTFRAGDGDRLTGEFVRGVLPDGRIVLQRYPDGGNEPSQVGIVDEGTTRWADPKMLGNYLGTGGTEVLFSGALVHRPDFHADELLALDAETLTWRRVTSRMLDSNQHAQPMTAPAGGAAFFGAGVTSEVRTQPLYRVDLGSGSVTKARVVGNSAQLGGSVVWTERFNTPNDTVTLDEPGRAPSSFDPETGACAQKDIALTGTRIVLMLNCTASDPESTDVVDRIELFTHDGTKLWTLDAQELGPVRVGDRFATITSWKQGEEGTYSYDLATDRFLRLTDSMSAFTGNETGAGNVVVWQRPVDGNRSAEYVVARMR